MNCQPLDTKYQNVDIKQFQHNTFDKNPQDTKVPRQRMALNSHHVYLAKSEPELYNLFLNNKISCSTILKVILAKQYIEKKYKQIKRKQLELETINEKINSLKLDDKQKEELNNIIIQRERQNIAKKFDKLTSTNYVSLAVIGKGSFGEVHVCIHKKSKKVYAVKKMSKKVIFEKNMVKNIREEQNILSKINSPWIVKLKESFQEGDYLFLAMEFIQGGDLLNLLNKRNHFSEDETKFYMAETLLALEALHKYNCVHRDIKPDNILIDKNGHIKIADLGLARIVNQSLFEDDIFDFNDDLKENEEKRKDGKIFSCVGSSSYIAPEIFERKGYGLSVDWWAYGILFYEMLFGQSPFKENAKGNTIYNILHYKETLKFPKKIKVSEEAKDLLQRLLTDYQHRLGNNGAEEIKQHKFFANVNWKKIREVNPPFIPQLDNDFDIKYCKENILNIPFIKKESIIVNHKDSEFIGYTYRDDLIEATNLEEIMLLINEKTQSFIKKDHLIQEKNKLKSKNKETEDDTITCFDTLHSIKKTNLHMEAVKENKNINIKPDITNDITINELIQNKIIKKRIPFIKKNEKYFNSQNYDVKKIFEKNLTFNLFNPSPEKGRNTIKKMEKDNTAYVSSKHMAKENTANLFKEQNNNNIKNVKAQTQKTTTLNKISIKFKSIFRGKSPK